MACLPGMISCYRGAEKLSTRISLIVLAIALAGAPVATRPPVFAAQPDPAAVLPPGALKGAASLYLREAASSPVRWQRWGACEPEPGEIARPADSARYRRGLVSLVPRDGPGHLCRPAGRRPDQPEVRADQGRYRRASRYRRLLPTRRRGLRRGRMAADLLRHCRRRTDADRRLHPARDVAAGPARHRDDRSPRPRRRRLRERPRGRQDRAHDCRQACRR